MYSLYRSESIKASEGNDSSPHYFSLTVIKSNVDQENEAILRNFLSKKLSRNSVFSDTGHISTIQFPRIDGSEIELAVYYIRFPSQISDSNNENSQNAAAAAPTSDCSEASEKSSSFHIACFLDSDKSKLDLFQAELDFLSAELIEHLSNKDSSSVEKLLFEWQSICMDYIYRVVLLLKDKLKAFLSPAVQGCPIEFVGFNKSLERDLKLFVDASRVLEQTSNMTSSRDSEVITEKCFKVISKDEEIFIEPQELNSAVDELVTQLTNLSLTKQAVQMKQALYAFRLTVSQELNSLRRMIGQAESDYYALFRLYTFLRDSKHSNLLLHHLITWELQQKEERKIVELVKTFLSENSNLSEKVIPVSSSVKTKE